MKEQKRNYVGWVHPKAKAVVADGKYQYNSYSMFSITASLAKYQGRASARRFLIDVIQKADKEFSKDEINRRLDSDSEEDWLLLAFFFDRGFTTDDI